MLDTSCGSIRAALAAHVSSLVDVQRDRDTCIVTLPIETLDGRVVGVFIEPGAKDYFLIHDGGKAVDELVLQGMKITPSVERGLSLIANRFGISYCDESFQAGSKIAELPSKAYAVGMSSAMAMANLLEHVLVLAEQPLEQQLGQLLRRWGKNRAKVDENVNLTGALKQHRFDFLVSPRRKGNPIAISVLNPTNGALAAAERFYFRADDLSSTRFKTWPIVAIEAKAETWSVDARKIVSKYAQRVIPIRTGEPPNFESISAALNAVG